MKITGQDYIETYISLKSLSLNKKDFDTYMSVDELDKLEQKTGHREVNLKKGSFPMAQSMDQESLKQHSRAILN